MSYAILSAPITTIDETHRNVMENYLATNMPTDWYYLDRQFLDNRYITCLNMSVDQFTHEFGNCKRNLNVVGTDEMLHLYHGMQAAVPFQNLKADAKYKDDMASHYVEMERAAKRRREISENPLGGDPDDPDERVRAGTHKRVKGEPEATGAGKGQKRSLEYVVPVGGDDDSDDDDEFVKYM